jgi:hypothetical protein
MILQRECERDCECTVQPVCNETDDARNAHNREERPGEEETEPDNAPGDNTESTMSGGDDPAGAPDQQEAVVCESECGVGHAE